jgi:hypothetical protein
MSWSASGRLRYEITNGPISGTILSEPPNPVSGEVGYHHLVTKCDNLTKLVSKEYLLLFCMRKRYLVSVGGWHLVKFQQLRVGKVELIIFQSSKESRAASIVGNTQLSAIVD